MRLSKDPLIVQVPMGDGVGHLTKHLWRVRIAADPDHDPVFWSDRTRRIVYWHRESEAIVCDANGHEFPWIEADDYEGSAQCTSCGTILQPSFVDDLGCEYD